MMFIESIRIRSSTQYSKAELIYFHKDSAQTILDNPVDIVLIAIPLLIQTYLIFVLTYYWMKKWKQPHCVAAPGCMISALNFFELAVAVAISIFGIHSGAALATVVGDWLRYRLCSLWWPMRTGLSHSFLLIRT